MSTTKRTTKHTPAQLEALARDAEHNAARFAHYDGMCRAFTKIAVVWWAEVARDPESETQLTLARQRVKDLEALLSHSTSLQSK